jgi:NAD-dependent deacetylase
MQSALGGRNAAGGRGPERASLGGTRNGPSVRLSSLADDIRNKGMGRHIVILTGAGVSAESGLGTFRDKQGEGIWTRFDPMELATPQAFARDPKRVLAFYDARRRNLLEAKPNAAHVALTRLEGELARQGGELTLVTQNIDDLHERAGSKRVLHMHGELLKARCRNCGATQDWRGDLKVADACPACERAGTLRPDVVWFGEMPLHLDDIDRALRCADLFVAIGTSGAVYPAAGFVAEARAYGVPTCEINLEAADNAYCFDEARYGPATQTVPAWVEEVIQG